MTDAENREKVIKELSWLIYNFPFQKNPKDEADRMCNAINMYCNDALAVLKEQAAQVMTLEDLHLDSDKPAVVCWIEFRDKLAVYVTAPYGDTVYACIPFLGTDFKMFCHRDAYEVSWRCWTNEPTHEQRQSVDWKGESDG